jgi:hypothetical protein
MRSMALTSGRNADFGTGDVGMPPPGGDGGL